MAMVQPFPALRAAPEHAAAVCELPYDVMSAEEARQMAAGNPRSFLHVSKPEIDFPPSQDPHGEAVYRKGKENFERMVREGWLRQDSVPAFYLYRQVMGEHSQTGLVALASCREYLENRIKRHEWTRMEKEEDRVRHLESLNAQTGPAFLLHRANAALEGFVSMKTAERAEVDFIAADGVAHSAWSVRHPENIEFIQKEFEGIPALYIADGHHRTAAAARVFQARGEEGGSGGFLAVIFSASQVQVLPYHRVVADLNGHTPSSILKRLRSVCPVERSQEGMPADKHRVGFYLAGEWHMLNLASRFSEAGGPVGNLDVSLLQEHVLGPLFGITDPRTSGRIDFVGGIRGTSELERLVGGGKYACAFSLFATGVEELLEVADAGEIMPPKSTWFEPKLRDGMFSHLI